MADVSTTICITADTTAFRRAIEQALRVCRRFDHDRLTKAQRKWYKAQRKNLRQMAERTTVTVVGP
jgi:hypothetical protein